MSSLLLLFVNAVASQDQDNASLPTGEGWDQARQQRAAVDVDGEENIVVVIFQHCVTCHRR